MRHHEARLFDEGDALVELNPSRLQTYLDCPRQYRFRYVDHRPERRSFPQTSLGRSVHRALRDFYALPGVERTLPTLLRQMRDAWDPTGYRTSVEAEAGLARAEEMMRVYFGMEDHAKVRAIALESKFSVQRPAAGIYVWGRIDRLDDYGDEYVIVDYKTGTFRQDPASVETSLPLSLYAMAVGEQFRQKVSRIVLFHLATGERVETRRDPDRLIADWKRLEEVGRKIRTDEEMAPEPGALCRWCDFLAACPEGREQVGPDAPALMRRTWKK